MRFFVSDCICGIRNSEFGGDIRPFHVEVHEAEVLNLPQADRARLNETPPRQSGVADAEKRQAILGG